MDDLGEASANLIKAFVENPQDDRYVNQIILLSGPRVWTLEETVQVLGKCARKDVTVEQVTFDKHAEDPKVVDALSTHGAGRASRDWTSVSQAISGGETAVLSGELERLLGRPAEDFETTVGRMLKSQMTLS